MTFHRNWFSTYEKYDGGIIYLGDDFPFNIVGHDRFLIKFPNWRVKGINEVLHILSLEQNLISVSKLNDVGVQVVFSDKGCKMVRGAMVLD